MCWLGTTDPRLPSQTLDPLMDEVLGQAKVLKVAKVPKEPREPRDPKARANQPAKVATKDHLGGT